MDMIDLVSRARKIRDLLDQEMELLFDEVEKNRRPAIWLPTKELEAELVRRRIDVKSWEERLCRLLSLAARSLEGEE